MVSAKPRPSQHCTASSTCTPCTTPSLPSMLPAALRPCCKGRLLSKLAGLLSLGGALYICLLLHQTGLTPGIVRQSRASGNPESGETVFGRSVLGNDVPIDDESSVKDFKQMSLEFVLENAGENRPDNLTAFFNISLQREVAAMRDALLLYKKEMSHFPCVNHAPGYNSSRSSPELKVTIVYSLVGIDSIVDAVVLMRTNFERLPENSVDDIIVTVEEEAEQDYKAMVEDLLDLCDVCRVFFFTGTIWEHRNAAVKFARGEILLFVDARVQPITDDWVWPLTQALYSSPKLVVSPHLRLRGGYQGRDFSIGFAKNEITWSMSVARGPIKSSEISEAIKLAASANKSQSYRGNIVVDQTAILKEVFAIRKSFFNILGGLDIEKTATGGEIILLSLKALNCGGNIALSLCSEVTLEIPNNIPPAEPKYTRPLTVQEKLLSPARQKKVLDSLRIVSHAELMARQALQTVDFQNPSFMGQVYLPGVYFNAAQEIWIDPYSKRYSACTVQPRLFSSSRIAKPRSDIQSADVRKRISYVPYNHKPYREQPSLVARVRQTINKHKCDTRNFRSLIAKRQPRMVSATRRATFYGYIRSADGLYAFGVSPAMSEDAIFALASSQRVVPALRSADGARFESLNGTVNSSQGSFVNRDPKLDNQDSTFHIVLTRNSSEWIGPFSHTNGAFVYQHSLCITMLPSNRLSLRKCLKGTREQLFAYTSQTIRPAGVPGEWACAKLPRMGDGTANSSPTVMASGPVFMSRCLGDGEGSTFSQFKMDVRFRDNCVV
ncbi:hypothetical protein EGW08_019805 [Elysia chlorotica]|uniref:Glycosyltransferase 2-like domain-containing protein n=1 Tax=Elysia chlorotica TaxID=188477 RepID=A0A433ST35_ELYCH|nr:hypothetical protein EGW08_019805 [Elysia chlorotica]